MCYATNLASQKKLNNQLNRMSRLLTSTTLPVYQGLFEYRIARENLKEFYGVRLFNGRRYDKAVLDVHEIRFYRRDVLRSVIPRF